MIYVLPQCLGHGPVAFVSVHDSREDILFATHDVHGGLISICVELLGVLIAAVIVEISGIDIKDQLPKEVGVGFQPTGGDGLFLDHRIKDFLIRAGRCFEVDVQRRAVWDDVLIDVGFLFPFVVPLDVVDLVFCQVGVPDRGAMHPIVSCDKYHLYLSCITRLYYTGDTSAEV